MFKQISAKLLGFLTIFCIWTLLLFGYNLIFISILLVELVNLFQKAVLVPYKFTARHLKLLKQKIFGAH